MSQQAATITSLPMAFEVVKAMQADGLEWGEGYRPLGRQALEEIIEDQMAAALSRTCTTCAGGTAPISGYAVGAAVHGLAVERERDRLNRAIAASIAENQTIVTEAAPPQAFQVRHERD